MIGNRDIFLDRTDVSRFSLQLNHCGIQECAPGYSYHIDSRPYHLIHFILGEMASSRRDISSSTCMQDRPSISRQAYPPDTTPP